MIDTKSLVELLGALLNFIFPAREKTLVFVEAALAELRRDHDLGSIVSSRRRAS